MTFRRNEILEHVVTYWRTELELGERVAWHQNEEDKNPLFIITRLCYLAGHDR